MSQVNKDNFFTATEAVFNKIGGIMEREPDYVSFANIMVYHDDIAEIKDGKTAVTWETGQNGEMNLIEYPIVTMWKNKDDGVTFLLRTEKVSSRYWYEDGGVYRESDHWGNVAKCVWELEWPVPVDTQEHLGFCKWEDFKLIEETA